MRASALFSVILSMVFVFAFPQSVTLPDCPEGEVRAPDGTCVVPSQDVGSVLCRRVQHDAQQAVLDAGPFSNRGLLVGTAARVVARWSDPGLITKECAGAIMNQFARGIPIEVQDPTGPEPECRFTISGTLIAEPGADYDTLDFTGSTFAIEVESGTDITPKIETLYLLGVPYTQSQFDLTSETAVRWTPSGTAFDATYAGPARLIFWDNVPTFMPGIPDPVGVLDHIELIATVAFKGVEYEMRIFFEFYDAGVFDASQLGDFCLFKVAGSASYVGQDFGPVPWSPEAAFGLRVANLVLTASQ